MADPIIGEDGALWCPEPDCERGPGGKSFGRNNIAFRGHYRKHEAAARREAVERGEPVDLPRRPKTRAKQPPLEDRLAASFGAIGGGLYMLPLPAPYRADGRTLVEHSRPMANALADLAQENDTVRKVCDLLAGGGAWGTFLVVMFAFCLDIGANHGWVQPAPQPLPSREPGPGPAPMDMETVAKMFGATPEQMAEAAAFAERMMAQRPPPLQPDGADPDLTGPGEARVA